MFRRHSGILLAALAIALLFPQPKIIAQEPGTVATTKPGVSFGAAQARLAREYGNLPLIFEPNQGQTDAQVKFLSRGRGYTLFLTAQEAVWVLPMPAGADGNRRGQHTKATRPEFGDPVAQTAPRMRLVGANRSAPVMGLEPLPGTSNYFIGKDPAQWHTNIPQYAKVQYRDIYPGVDLLYYGNGGQVEMDFVVEPGADPRRITLDFAGARSLQLDAEGDLVINADGQELHLHKPRIVQEVNSSQQIIPGGYVLKGRRTVGFEIGHHDVNQRLVIDPVVTFSTYLGGSGNDVANAIAIDTSGNAYVTGSAESYEPLSEASLALGTLFVTKLNSSGSALIYSVFIGPYASGTGIAVDASENAYVTGLASGQFPTTQGAFQASLLPGKSGHSAFVLKLNATGTELAYSTYLTGSGSDEGRDIAVDAAGNAYVTGETRSNDFPLANPAQVMIGGADTSYPDAFVAKINATGSGLLFSTYLGGNSRDVGNGIATDTQGNAYVVGETSSNDFPVANAFQPFDSGPYSGVEAFITKLSATGSLVYSTALGGSHASFGRAIAVDNSGNAYVTGWTESGDFPIVNPFQPSACDPSLFCGQAFVAKLAASGSSLQYSTYLHGDPFDTYNTTGVIELDVGTDIAVDAAGKIYVSGSTNATYFPLVEPVIGLLPEQLQDRFSWIGTFLAVLDPSATAPLFSTYSLGMASPETGLPRLATKLALDASGNIYLAGVSRGGVVENFAFAETKLPLVNPLQEFGGGTSPNDGRPAFDAIVAKVENLAAPAVGLSDTSLNFGSQGVGTVSGNTLVLHNVGSVPLNIASITIDGDFAQTNTCGNDVPAALNCVINVSFTPTTAGARTGTITITDNASGSPHTVALGGTGTAPAVGFSQTSLSFGNQVIGTTSTLQSVTLTNTGTLALNVSRVDVSGDFQESNNCPASLGPGASCTLNVTFTPTTTGIRNGVLSITDNADGSPHQVALSGTGIVDFSLNLSLASATVTAGGSTTTTITINPQGSSFASAISFSCSGLPALASCSFSPSSVTPGNTPVSTTLTITTTAPSAALLGPPGPWLDHVPAYAVWLPLLGLAWTGAGLARVRSKRRKQKVWLVAGLMLVLLGALAGCGGSEAVTTPTPTLNPGTPPGSYTVTVNATSGSTVHSTTFTLTVQ